jgi:uncharacterized protein YcbK (DUF882 family)
MSARGVTVLLFRPGRGTVRMVIPRYWPYALIALLLAPVLAGAAARIRWASVHGEARAVARAALATPLAPAVLRSVLLQDVREVGLARVSAHEPGALVASLSAATGSARLEHSAAGRTIDARPILRAFRGRTGRSSAASPQDAAELRLHVLHSGERVRVRPFDETGAARPEAFAQLSHLMRCRVTGEEVAIDPRLAHLLARLAAAYRQPIQLISGHRTAHANGTSPTSQHTTGRAADVRIPGVTIEELRQRAIELGAGGVGLYPEKGFVHVDVRRHPRFYWVYTEAAGEQPYERFSAGLPQLGVPVPQLARSAPHVHED